MLIAAHNLTAMNAGRQYGVVTKNRAKTAEKLSSGYDINRAADNAAGLAISEKMRRLIRGLDQGTRNAEDGVSWTQIGDGALNEAHDILHRMTELSIQSLNETNSEKDRSYLQSEFEHLQTELDRISKTTKFNELNIFEEHKPTYYQCEGDVKWNPEQLHEVKDGSQDYTVMLDKGTYDRDTLVTELNDKLNSIGIEAYKSGSKIGFRSLVGGSQQTFSINYDENSALKAIYGETVTKYPGVTASFENDNLKLTSDPGVKLSLSSDTGGGFITSQKNVETLKNTIVKGYTSTKHGTIDGYNISQPIEIDEYNNNLSFTYEDNGVSRDISIEIDEYKKYTYDELQQKLTELLDAAAGPGELTVSVNANGVVIKTVGVGPDNRLSNPKGDFYEKIMCYSREMDYNQSNAIVDKDGKQKVTGAYTIGRQDVVSGTTKIRAGVSDELKLDFTVNNTLYTLEMKLDPGEYTGSQLQQHIQEKLNEQLVDQGFSSGFIEVGLGDILTNVVGANDDKALNFRVADDIPAKEEGDYIIDGVGGNAAFAVFYSTDGELIPAYVEGSKDVTNGVRLKNNEHDLSFTVDGVTYDIELGASYYPADSLVETMNKKLEDAGAPLVATVEDGKVKISHTSLGRHSIEISGSARDEIFFREHGAQEKDKGVRIQLSSEVEDFLDIPRSEYSTTLLGINTICISKVDNASKALDRVSKAVDIVSQLRSKFGSTQNRLEHAIASNENKSENTQASESRIRDADMSERMMELAKYNILQQAGEAMMAQSNKSNQGILSLLQ